MTKDLCYNDVGFYGSKDITISNIERITNNCLRFTNSSTSYAACDPSSSGFIKGNYYQCFGFKRKPQHRRSDNPHIRPLNKGLWV